MWQGPHHVLHRQPEACLSECKLQYNWPQRNALATSMLFESSNKSGTPKHAFDVGKPPTHRSQLG
jgi:hypothetical protein